MIIKMYISTLTDRKEIEKNEKKKKKKEYHEVYNSKSFFYNKDGMVSVTIPPKVIS